MCPQKTLDQVIADKLAETLMVDTSHVVSPPGAEERRMVNHGGQWFQINRGHAFRDHATGPATNPRFSGPDKATEVAIMNDIIARIGGAGLPAIVGIATAGTGVWVHGTPIRYNVIQLAPRPGTGGQPLYMISDYMVWQGDPNALT